MPIGSWYGCAGEFAIVMAGGIGWELFAILGWRVFSGSAMGLKRLWVVSKKKRYRGHGAW